MGSIFEENFGFAGFTSTTYTGNISGRISAHAICAAAFPGAHLCHATEYLRTESLSAVPAGGAWLDQSSDLNATSTVTSATPLFGRHTGGACQNWTNTTTSYVGYTINPDGGIASALCNTIHPVACCL